MFDVLKVMKLRNQRPHEPENAGSSLKYDSRGNRHCDLVEAGEDSITVNGKTIKIYAEKDAKDIPWGKHGR